MSASEEMLMSKASAVGALSGDRVKKQWQVL